MLFTGRQGHGTENYGVQSRVGNTEVSGGNQVVTANTFCHQMPSDPKPIPLNYLHTCDNGPIVGRYIILTGVTPDVDNLEIAEVYAWDSAQPDDQSKEHGE